MHKFIGGAAKTILFFWAIFSIALRIALFFATPPATTSVFGIASRTRESFNAEKIRNGIVKSCEKRPVSAGEIDAIVADISKEVYNSMESEISTKVIGEMVMERLKKVDEVAYVRYASVYRSFKDLSSFMAELKQMMKAEKAERAKGDK